jgi:hypothetical protein
MDGWAKVCVEAFTHSHGQLCGWGWAATGGGGGGDEGSCGGTLIGNDGENEGGMGVAVTCGMLPDTPPVVQVYPAPGVQTALVFGYWGLQFGGALTEHGVLA